MTLEETTNAEIENMEASNSIIPPLDAKRYWTTVAVLATTAVITFLIANWALPSKVDDLSGEIKEMRSEQALMKDSQITSKDIDRAIQDSREYTDRRVNTLEGDLKISMERILSNQSHIKTDIQESKEDRKTLTKSIEQIGYDVARVKFAVERTVTND